MLQTNIANIANIGKCHKCRMSKCRNVGMSECRNFANVEMSQMLQMLNAVFTFYTRKKKKIDNMFVDDLLNCQTIRW